MYLFDIRPGLTPCQLLWKTTGFGTLQQRCHHTSTLARSPSSRPCPVPDCSWQLLPCKRRFSSPMQNRIFHLSLPLDTWDSFNARPVPHYCSITVNFFPVQILQLHNYLKDKKILYSGLKKTLVDRVKIKECDQFQESVFIGQYNKFFEEYWLSPMYHFWHFWCEFCNFCVFFAFFGFLCVY